jgi:protocatechuate 3,4-dioxygenase beta subunit
VFGRAFTQRLITQMYFPDDPLFDQDPIAGSVRDPAARQRMVSRYDHARTVPEWALGYEFDIVLRGRDATVFENGDGAEDDDE